MARKPQKWALRARKCDFLAYFSISSAYRAENGREMKKIRSNKGFQATAHKLSHGAGLRSLHSLFLQPVGRRLNPDVQQMSGGPQNPNAPAEG